MTENQEDYRRELLGGHIGDYRRELLGGHTGDLTLHDTSIY